MPARSLLAHIEYFYAHSGEVAYVQRRGYRRESWTYGRIVETASQFARELDSREIRKGARVVLWGESSAEWVVAFLGCVMRSVVVVPMDRAGSPEFAVRVFHQVGAKLLVCSRDLLQRVGELPRLVLEDLPSTVAHREQTRFSLLSELQREDTLQIIFTSGTTAEPRGVVITHGNVLANLEPVETEIKKYLKYELLFRFISGGRRITFLNLLPLSHVFGQFLGIFIPPLLAGTVVFQEALNPAEVLATIHRERVNVLVAVPRMLESMKNKIERDFQSADQTEWLHRELQKAEHEHFAKRWWQFRRMHRQFGWGFWAFISGGATLDFATEEFWRRMSFVVIQGYGLTETTSLISVNHPFHRGRGSIGKVLPGRDIKLSESSEILVRGENVAKRYWQSGSLTPVTSGESGDGWFHTGDLGELDAEGYLHFKGRKKNVIVTPEGMNVYPEDLEAALRRQPGVRDCVVFGLSRNGNAEPCAVLIPSGAEPQSEVVRTIQRTNEELAPYQQIRHWYVWPETDFPRTATHKPRTSMIQQVAEEHLRGGGRPRPATTQGTLKELVEQVSGRPLQTAQGGDGLDANLGLSSIERVDLLCAIEDRYQIDLDESDLAEVKTLGDLESVIHKRSADGNAEVPALKPSVETAAPALSATAAEVDPAALASANARARAHRYSYPRWAQRWPLTWIRIFIYYLLTWPGTHLMAWPRVIGREKLRDLRGPALIICNHVTYVDVGFVLFALPLRLRHKLTVAMEGERLWALRYPPPGTDLLRRVAHPLAYFLIVALFDVFPLPKLSGFRESFAYAGESADRGYSVLVFPEGLRTRTGEIMKFQSGIGMLASRLNLPVIPMRIDGLFELKQRGQRFAKAGAVTVRIGDPIRVDAQMPAEGIARELEERVRNL